MKTIWVPCAYNGFGEIVPPCTNKTREKMIFCRYCLALLPSHILEEFRRDFKPRLTYDEAVWKGKHLLAIVKVCEVITFRKAQLSLFSPIPTNVTLSQKERKEKR